MILWFEKHLRYPVFGKDHLERAAVHGNLCVLKHATERNIRLETSIICASAAFGGHLEVLKWLHANEYIPDRQSCEAAAEGGHLEVLEWLRANECPWDQETCRAAAQWGHLELLKWARENGCPWDPSQCFIYTRHKAIRDYIKEKGEKIDTYY